MRKDVRNKWSATSIRPPFPKAVILEGASETAQEKLKAEDTLELWEDTASWGSFFLT